VALPPSSVVRVGRGVDCEARLDDPDLSRTHASVRWTVAGALLTDEGSRNGVFVDDEKITSTELAAGSVAELGGSVLAVRMTPDADADVTVVGPAARFNRPPRTAPEPAWPTVVFPAPPVARSQQLTLPIIGVLMPLLVVAILHFVVGLHGPYLFLLGLSPLVALGTYLQQRRAGRVGARREQRIYRAELRSAAEKLRVALAAEAATRRERSPDPAALLAAAEGPTATLWERRPEDSDALRLRLGLGTRPALTKVTGLPDRPQVPLVPVRVDLPEERVLGLTGSRGRVLRSARALLCELAAAHAPGEVQFVIIADADTSGDGGNDWRWAVPLPHLRERADDPVGMVRLADSETLADEQIEWLGVTVAARRAAGAAPDVGRGASPPHNGPAIVVLFDSPARVRTDPRLRELLRAGPDHGMYAVALDERPAGLPQECRAVVEIGTDNTAVLRLADRPAVKFLPDGVSAEHARRLARALAPLFVATGPTAAAPPANVGFLAAHGLTGLSPADVVEGWERNIARAPTATLGSAGTGPFRLDLRNGRDGPHVLVGGRTGAGKSDLLNTFVTSLALGLPPSALEFLLLDFKEGSGLGDLAALPHTRAVITNVAAAEVDRFLTTMSAMRTRRQQALGDLGLPNYDDYVAARAGHPIEIARLMIVVDEFAELRDRYPGALERLVEIARLGRSAGMHLVLGTQLVSRHVTDEIVGNTNLHVCLTVDSAAESSKVVGRPDAGVWADRLPGRAAANSDSGFTIFQTGWLGARSPKAGGPAAPCTVEPLRRLPGRAAATPETATDHEVVQAAINAAAEQTGEIDADRVLPPALPPVVRLAELPGPAALRAAGPGDFGFVVGLEDLPAELAQRPYRHVPARAGHLLAQGSGGSGRTTLLRTIAVSVASSWAPDQAHLHVVDFGGSGLRDLTALPHVGTLVEGEDDNRLERLLALLSAIVRERQERLARLGVATWADARRRGTVTEPYLLLLIDRYDIFWERYWERDNGLLVNQVGALLRDGPVTGLWCVVTAGGTGFAIRSGLGIRSRVVLPMASRDDYVAAGLSPGRVSGTPSPGRAYRLPEQTELQVATVAAEAAPAVEQWGRSLAATHGAVPVELLPPRLAALPDQISLAEAEGLRSAGSGASTGPRRAVATIGVGGVVLRPVDVDLDDLGGLLLVSGPAQSGRSTTLLTILRTVAREAGWTPLVLAPRPSPLRSVSTVGATPVTSLTRPDEIAARLPGLVEGAGGRVLLVIDDAERLFDPPAVAALNPVLRDAADREMVVVAASRPESWVRAFRNWGEELRTGRSGILLNPRTPEDGMPLNLPLPRAARPVTLPGRGLVVVRGRPSLVQIATTVE